MKEPNISHTLISDMKSLDLSGPKQYERGAVYQTLRKHSFRLITYTELVAWVLEWWKNGKSPM